MESAFPKLSKRVLCPFLMLVLQTLSHGLWLHSESHNLNLSSLVPPGDLIHLHPPGFFLSVACLSLSLAQTASCPQPGDGAGLEVSGNEF